MFNVGFGDCFTILDENEALLIDCGTKHKSTNFNRINSRFNSFDDFVDDLKNKIILPYNPINALITHFDNDHYSGFEYLHKTKNYQIFDKVFIPYMHFDKNKKCELIELAIYFYILFGKSSITKKFSSSILSHVILVIDLVKKSNIKCLSTGDIIKIRNRNFDVIWPDKKNLISSNLKRYLIFLNKITNNWKELNELKNNIMDNLSRFYNLISNDQLNEKESIEIRNIQLELINKLDKLRIQSKEMFMSLNNMKFKRNRYYPLMFFRNMNECSVVFHDKKLLMTGDITKHVFEKYLYNRLNEMYSIIKAPHHGTNTHYSNKLPISCNLLISTAKFRNYGSISKEYYYHPCAKGFRFCSSGKTNCDILNNKKRCINGVCQNNEIIMSI